jgi:dual specificity protein kinase YAK1
MTIDIVKTFNKCNPTFSYKSVQNPKRILTKPSKGMKNNGYDNENSDYILCVHDLLGVEEGRK